MDKCSHPTEGCMDPPAQDNTFCGFNKASLNKKPSQIIQEDEINTTFNSYQLRECDGGMNSGGEWFHSCTLELPQARWAGPSGKSSNHTGILEDRSNETEALSFFLRKTFYWPISLFVAAGRNPHPYQRFCRSLSIFLQRKATERVK